jgi:hypothetical protein
MPEMFVPSLIENGQILKDPFQYTNLKISFPSCVLHLDPQGP